MKKTACIYTSITGVGLIADVNLIINLIQAEYDVDVEYIDDINATRTVFGSYDIGIFLQEFGPEWLERNKKNIFIPNEEWLQSSKLQYIHLFDKVIVKSSFAKQLLIPYNKNTVNTGFVSYNRDLPAVKPKNKFLHLVGRSIQKGTEPTVKSFENTKQVCTVIDSTDFYNLKHKNINHINGFLTKEQITYQLNNHKIHLCCSVYEGWGHYLYEGLSTGALIYATKIPMFLEWLDPDLVVFVDCKFSVYDQQIGFLKNPIERLETYCHQFGWVVDTSDLTSKIKNSTQLLKKHKPEKVKQFFKHLQEKNSKALLENILHV